uniref:Uncharacterized protein n=1 Tax=Panagrellus redivivus TaxID=6233 RepID=A0A7E4W5M2_PANRE
MTRKSNPLNTHRVEFRGEKQLAKQNSFMPMGTTKAIPSDFVLALVATQLSRIRLIAMAKKKTDRIYQQFAVGSVSARLSQLAPAGPPFLRKKGQRNPSSPPDNRGVLLAGNKPRKASKAGDASPRDGLTANSSMSALSDQDMEEVAPLSGSEAGGDSQPPSARDTEQDPDTSNASL